MSSIASTIKSKFETAKSNVSAAVSSIASTIKSKFESAKGSVSTAAGNIASTIKSKFNTAKENATSAFSTLKSKVESAISNIKVSSSAENVAKTIKNKFESAASSAKKAISGLSGDVSSSLNAAKKVAKNFSWSIPRPSLPKITLKTSSTTVDGKTITYPSGFDVKWYKKAYENAVMFTNPTILQTPSGAKGFGDGHGGEIVLSDKKLREIAGGGQATYNINIYGAEGQSVNALADAVQKRLVALERQRKAAGIA